MRKKSLILVNGDKGGVGKSFCVKVILSALVENEPEMAREVGLLDCDTRNPDVAYLFEDKISTGRFDLSTTEGWSHMFGWIEEAEQSILVVSLPAQVGTKADELGGEFAEALEMANVNLNMVWMLDSGLDSIKLYEHCMAQEWPIKRTFVVKNSFLGREFTIWEKSDARKNYLAANPWGELDLPALDITIRDALVENRLNFVEGFSNPDSSFNNFQRIRLKNYFNKASSNLKPIFDAISQDLSEAAA